MKVYISAKFENIDEVRSLMKKLQAKGYEIATDWTQHKSIKPYKDNPDLAKEYAVEEMEGVLDCDIFIHLTVEKEGTAMFAELGAAIALNVKTGKPEKIYAVGRSNTRTTFYFHPSVKRIDSIEEVLAEL